MKVKMIDLGGITPTRAHYNDAGLDCFANESKSIAPGDRARIRLGFGLELPDGYVALLLPRSSLNANGVRVEVGTIDSGYRGEVQAVVVNDTKEFIVINQDMKVAQLVVMPIAYVELVDELGEDRATGGFGSSGK